MLEDTSSTAVSCVEHVPVIMASLKQCSERSGLLWHASASAAGNRIECMQDFFSLRGSLVRYIGTSTSANKLF